MTDYNQVSEYVYGALRYPIHDTEQIVSMAVLHFPDLTEKQARWWVAEILLRLAIEQTAGVRR